jgi:hypothetical protein
MFSISFTNEFRNFSITNMFFFLLKDKIQELKFFSVDSQQYAFLNGPTKYKP